MCQFKVYKTACQNCLFSTDKIVSPQRAKRLIQQCIKEGTYFICHEASMKQGDICCKGFYDKVGNRSAKIELMNQLNDLIDGRFIEFLEQPNAKRLPSFKEMKCNR